MQDDDIRLGRGAGEHVRWVFGYGSLMWRPDFAFAQRVHATLDGLERAFCIYSVHHRGTPDRPGLVLGLAPGSGVRGVAYRVEDADWAQTYAYLLEREQPTETYQEATAPLRLEGGEIVRGLVFLSDVRHPQWAGALTLQRQAELIAGAQGLSGRNVDYLRDLIAHLEASGEPDPHMQALMAAVEMRERAGAAKPAPAFR